VHGFGGGVLGYMDLARSLGPEQPFLALAARGLDSNQAPDDDVRVMAARYAEVVRATQPEGPYYLAGYCFGGVVAYELAVQLTRAGQPVAFVGLFEGYAPNVLGAPSLSPAGAALAFAQNLPHWVKDFAGVQARHWRERLGGPSADGRVITDEAALAQVRHIQAQHDLALQRYVPPAYGGAVHLFRARGHALRRAHDPLRGWGRLAAGGVRLHLLPGAHYNILELPNVTAFAQQLAAALAAEQPSIAGN
jgi:thioesterase domain-containing protein